MVRGDAIDDAAALATAGPSDKTGPAASVVVPKLPRSDCARTVAKSEGFDLSTTSFGSIGLGVGLPLLMSGFLGYFNVIPTGSISSLLLIYGFIISLIGFALQYAKLEPLECVTYEDAAALRESQTTAILTQVRNDVTRYRYGDEQHLEEALAIIFRYNRPGGLRKNQAPKLVGIAEQVIVDRYALVLKFESPKMELGEWTDRREKIQGVLRPRGDLRDHRGWRWGRGGGARERRVRRVRAGQRDGGHGGAPPSCRGCPEVREEGIRVKGAAPIAFSPLVTYNTRVIHANTSLLTIDDIHARYRSSTDALP